MRELAHFVLCLHWQTALGAAALFGLGLALSLPVSLLRLKFAEWLPVHVLRAVLRLMGPRPGLARLTAVIWTFNAVAMFVYMAGGFHPLLPTVFAVWTGLNIGLLLARERRGERDTFRRLARPPGDWTPSPLLALVCGVLVLVLELPSFWYAIAMGISMGRHVQGGADYLAELGPRAWAYVRLIVPVLLVSAAAEAVAVRAGMQELSPPGTEADEDQRPDHLQ